MNKVTSANRAKSENRARHALPLRHCLLILLILLIGGIGVQTLTSCSSDDGGGDPIPPAVTSSSSSEVLQNYCVYPETGVCVSGSYSECPGGGLVSNDCPFGSSSSGDDVPSSGSVEPSSSSSDDVPSSGSVEPSSSSSDDVPSSGSVEPSSSSAQPSSSSSVTSWCGTAFLYNPNTHGCCSNSITFNLSTHFCEGNNVIPLCSGLEYNTNTHGCCGNAATFPFSTHFCYNDSKVGIKCGTRTETYDPDLYECREISKIYLKGGFVDSRDGKFYNAVLIGTQTWMAENLNFAVEGSKCYDDSEDNCTKYGRLYNRRGVCPSGWHLGWVGNNNDAIKATSGWNNDGNGTDDYGFAALPGGMHLDGRYHNAGNRGCWWTSISSNYGDSICISYNNEIVWGNSQASIAAGAAYYSIRCVKD